MKRVEVYGQQIRDKVTGELKPCRYCESAKNYLTNLEYPFVYRDIGNAADRAELFRRNPNAKTVPQIFIGETLVGGFDDLCKLPMTTLQQMIGE